MPEAAETIRVRCSGCDRGLECCALCQSDECGAAICYRCLALDTGQTSRQPHEHGG